MNNKLSFIVCVITILSLGIFSRSDKALSADWPMWRYDEGRTAASPENLPEKVDLLWVRQYSPRTMVWDDPLNQDLMPYDKVFEPVVMGKTMFVGFNDSDKLIAIDTETGEEKWTFYADGPLRLPPAAWQEKVYFTCDDGYLYCLDSQTGRLLWRFRGGPSDRKIIGNKRLISTWPARGAPVINNGVVYWSASIWPFMGIFIYALDAGTGKIIWCNDENGSRYMLQPHNAPSFAGVAPQGAFVIAGNSLLVPGGRSVPACLELKTGKFQYYHLAASGKTGGSFVCARGDIFFNHSREGMTTVYDLQTGTALAPDAGNYPVLTEESIYFSGESITAYSSVWIHDNLEEWRKNKQKIGSIFANTLKKNFLWKINVNARGDLIKAGDCLYAAGDHCITAVRLSGNEKPKIIWTKTIDGNAGGLLTADNKLFAVTVDGNIVAFGAQTGSPKRILDRSVLKGVSENVIQKALSLLSQTGVHEGYALFYGAGDGSIIEALANCSQLHIIAIEIDHDKVQKLRKRFDDNSLYGKNIAILEGDPSSVDVPPYMASLTVVQDSDSRKHLTDGAFVRRLYHAMRPYNGAAWFPLSGEMQNTFARIVESSKLSGIKIVRNDSSLVLVREGAIPGSGAWTHNYGNVANTAKSDDELVKLPLGILWFGGSSNLDVLPRHGHGPSEQVIGGRLFIQGTDCLSARDVFTGRPLWKVNFPDLGTFGQYYDETYKPHLATNIAYNQEHIPGANIRGTNYVVTQDRIYIIHGKSDCYVLDVATGERLQTFRLPPREPKEKTLKKPEWGYLGVYKDKLIAGYDFVAFSDLFTTKKDDYSLWEDFDKSANKALIVMNRYTGKVIWHIKADYGFLNNGIAAGNDMLFCIDKLPPFVEQKLQRRGNQTSGDSRLLALDINSGNVIWQKSQELVFGSFISFSENYGMVLQSTRPSRDMMKGEDGNRMNAFSANDGKIIWDKQFTYSTFPILHGNKIITEDGVVNLLTGEPLSQTDPLTDKKIPWQWKRYYGCNYPIACENLITFRSGAAGFYDLTRAGGTGNWGGFKSGCTANLIAADGVLNAPDFTRTCNCPYQNQTSLALITMPEAEIWTFNPFKWDGTPVKRVGINFGAPGDRMADNGTLWLDFPGVGGDSPDIPVSTNPATPEWYRYHSSRFTGNEYAWVAASGGRGINNFKITLTKEPVKEMLYTVRLFFAEPDFLEKGDRIFNVSLQGNQVLSNFDICKETEEPRKVIVKKFNRIKVDQDLLVNLTSGNGSRIQETVISGIEIIAEN